MEKFKEIMRHICLIALGANVVIMGFAWLLPSVELFLLGAISSVLVLFGFLYGLAPAEEE